MLKLTHLTSRSLVEERLRLKFCVCSRWCGLFDPLERISVCDSYLLGVYKLYV